MSDLRDQTTCDGSDDPRKRCGYHHCTGLAHWLGGYECCCGDGWLQRNICASGAQPGDPVSIKDKIDAFLAGTDTTGNDWQEAFVDTIVEHAIQPALDAKDTEIARYETEIEHLTTSVLDAYRQARAAETRATAAEAERDQLRERVAAYENAQHFEVACAGCGHTMALLADTAAERDQHAGTITRIRNLHRLATHNGTQYCRHCNDGLIHPGLCETLATLDQPDGDNPVVNDQAVYRHEDTT